MSEYIIGTVIFAGLTTFTGVCTTVAYYSPSARPLLKIIGFCLGGVGILILSAFAGGVFCMVSMIGSIRR